MGEVEAKDAVVTSGGAALADDAIGTVDGVDGDARASFRTAYRGWFSGLLAWADLDKVFALVRAAPEGWWVYDTREAVPDAPETADEIGARLDEIMAFLRKNHKADYCGFVYVDDRARPRFIKVYDPRQASSCSLGAPVPIYTLSRLAPEPLPFRVTNGGTGEGPQSGASGRGLFGRIFGRWS